jgi:hypothetical protein
MDQSKRKRKRGNKWLPSKHTSGRWRVVVPARWSDTGKQQDRYFATKAKAEEFIADTLDERAEHGKQAVSGEERHWIQVVKHELGDLAKLREVLDHWRKTGAGVKPILVRDAVERFKAFRFADKLNKETVRDISWRLSAFSERFGDRFIHQITPGEIEDWLQGYSEGWARHSMNKRIRPLFHYAARQHWLIEQPFDHLKAPQTPGGSRDIYTPDELHDMIEAAFESVLEKDLSVARYIAFASYGFFKVQELVRRHGSEPVLCWRDVLLERGLIRVPEEVAKSTRRKTSGERFVPIHPALDRWIHICGGPGNPNDRVIPVSVRKFRSRFLGVLAEAGVDFVPNGLRHSAISYRLAGDPAATIGKVAEYAGNSEASCRRHYLKVLTPEDGARWFGVIDRLLEEINKPWALE